MPDLKYLIAGGAAIITAISLLFVGEQTRPVERIEDAVSAPAAPIEQLCPSGWRDTSSAVIDIVVKSCSKDNWLVVLSQDGNFSHAWKDGSPDFVFDSSKVPGW